MAVRGGMLLGVDALVPAAAGITLVAHTAAQGTSGGVTSAGINTSGANLIVLASIFYGGATEPTISDSKGNVWVPLTKWGTAPASKVRFFYCASPIVGALHTFSSTGASSFPALAVIAFSGANAVPFDAENGADGAQPGTVTPGAANEVLVSAISDDNSGSVASGIGSGFIYRDGLPNAAGASFGVALAYLIETTAVPKNPTWTGGSGGVVSAQAAFKAA